MTFSPYFLISLEGFINIFIYLNNLSQEYVIHRNKGFKGLKAAIQPEQVSLNPFNPFFLLSAWYGGGLEVKSSFFLDRVLHVACKKSKLGRGGSMTHEWKESGNHGEKEQE